MLNISDPLNVGILSSESFCLLKSPQHTIFEILVVITNVVITNVVITNVTKALR
jgi:hypothetical protein